MADAITGSVAWFVAKRNGKKGPGKVVTVVSTEAEAKEVKAILDADNDGTEVIINDRPITVIETVESFKAKHEAAKVAAKARMDAMAALTEDQKVALGLK